MTTYPVNVRQGYAIWLGALARLDLLSGEDKYLTVIVPRDVTIHRTPINRANEVFINQAGTLLKPCYNASSISEEFVDQMERHEIHLNCDGFQKANFDIVVEGLGWVSVQGRGFVNFMLYLPPGIKYHIRTDPLLPFEV